MPQRLKQPSPRAALLGELVNEAMADPKTDSKPERSSGPVDRFNNSPEDSCVWCGLVPPRGKSLLCQACNVYRRQYGRPPTMKAVERRRAKLVDKEAFVNRLERSDFDRPQHDDSSEWDILQ